MTRFLFCADNRATNYKYSKTKNNTDIDCDGFYLAQKTALFARSNIFTHKYWSSNMGKNQRNKGSDALAAF